MFMTSEPTIANTGKDLVEISVNNKPISVPHETTGAEILRSAGVPADFELYRIAGKEELPVLPDEKIEVHSHERFIASPVLEPS